MALLEERPLPDRVILSNGEDLWVVCRDPDGAYGVYDNIWVPGDERRVQPTEVRREIFLDEEGKEIK